MCARQNVRITSQSLVLSLPISASSTSQKIRSSNIDAAGHSVSAFSRFPCYLLTVSLLRQNLSLLISITNFA
jgi:hypothetical protein